MDSSSCRLRGECVLLIGRTALPRPIGNKALKKLLQMDLVLSEFDLLANSVAKCLPNAFDVLIHGRVNKCFNIRHIRTSYSCSMAQVNSVDLEFSTWTNPSEFI